jgi:outer membrane protein OmpA-like peptidoglycan-associated protein
MAVRRELARQGVEVKEVTGMGDELPVAGNDLEQGACATAGSRSGCTEPQR